MSGRPMVRHSTRARSVGPIIAYDLETTPIKRGTPELRYFTAYDGTQLISERVSRLSDVTAITTELMQQHTKPPRFVAWNGNRFDGRFIANGYVESSDEYAVHPYLTRSRSLRGFHIADEEKIRAYFYDGIAMTGMLGTSLKKFLALYAPELQKMEFDFESVEFDANSQEHREYAERDSIGLWHGMVEVESIVRNLTGLPLSPTIGNLGIKYFMSKMPEGKMVWRPSEEVLDAVHGSALRGGYCWCARQYRGKVDKYDLNQAYAAAMRETQLPCGQRTRVKLFDGDRSGIYCVTISHHTFQPIPFYIREYPRGTPRFTHGQPITGYITTDELVLLDEHGWRIENRGGWVWEDSFTMGEMVNELEHLRMTCKGGPQGAEGRMIKGIGNNAYGKTLEQLDGVAFVMSKKCPPGYLPYHAEDDDMRYVWYTEGTPYLKPYHQPQVGTFITASVRCKVLRTAWSQPERIVYADTDCLMVEHGTPLNIEIHPSRYGAWEEEANGEQYLVIGKKIYANLDDRTIHAKGLRVRELTILAMEEWFNGNVPKQTQVQLQSFMHLSGEMFRTLDRKGTNPWELQHIQLTPERRYIAR